MGMGNDDEVAQFLIRERHWNEAIRFLENFCRYGFPGQFYLAMAHWGHTGELSQELCKSACRWYLGGRPSVPDRPAYSGRGGCPVEEAQEASLLLFGIGDKDDASAFLDHAVKGPNYTGISWWTFREASPAEFRQHCEEQRRMIQGEPIRPAFLGPQS
jgi:hypothetical protein